MMLLRYGVMLKGQIFIKNINKNFRQYRRLLELDCLFFSTSPCKMEDVKDIKYGPLPADSPYVKPFRLYYTQNGVEKNWDCLKVHDSVAIIIFNVTRKKLVLVKQFRPAVYYGIVSEEGDPNNIDYEKFPPKIGITLELCAGIVDKNKSLKEIAQEEVLEECGYDVPLDKIEEVLVYRSGVGVSSAVQSLFYCEVTDELRKNKGGGVDHEIIEIAEFSIEEIEEKMKPGNVHTSPPSFLFGILWFLTNKAPLYR
uniref:Uridine diphosphate glucose pyrophosphatase NUDT14 n=1 Tax=Culicoides sonorensis TaxID=179676 RepID=A0A336MRY2_CULSO